MNSMLSLLQQTVSQKLFRPLDVQFAYAMVEDENPLLLLIAALLSAESGAGHVCLPLDRISPKYLFEGRQPELAVALWSLSGKPDHAQIVAALQTCPAVSQGNLSTPMVLSYQRNSGYSLYLQRMWQSERRVADFFASVELTDAFDEMQIRRILDELFGVAAEGEVDWQKVAAAVAVTSRISVISGGPGTGKTTTVAKLLVTLIKLYEKQQLSIQLAAPTGKAAAKLTESLRDAVKKLALTPEQWRSIPEQAQTIHRLLGAQPDSQKLRYGRDNPLSLDILIIDEASMVDLPMMAHLIDALPPRAKVIFLGDKDQLASVEAGAVLGDICRFAEQGYSTKRAEQLGQLTGCQLMPYATSDSGNTVSAVRDCLCLLRKSYRFHSASGIGQLASAVNQGDRSGVSAVLNQAFPDVYFNPLSEDEDYQRLLAETASGYYQYLAMVNERAPEKTILAEFNRFRLLCALREGPFGVAGLNQRVEQLLHRKGVITLPKSVENRGYAGRPIMILRNDSTLGLFNGDIGIMLRNQDNELRAYFQLSDGQIKGFQPNRLPQHETAYVMTVHKSQGSEFEHTALVLPTQYSPIVSRELVYTALTRAREKLTIYAHRPVLDKAVATATQRRSGLEEWFNPQ
ncbi:exodeoxyribonuclease V subunit alpha [Xenorhabdus nematophila]|nr:exodeoxyribonuclease V subunit alpha [Xenorhabdus nematophila]KHD28855.1 exonuclease V subunit alpha [Xenorhabdus nematophila]MCB4424099.1 exodeoxyribonuclease V subunit alpha [Xenorhabdus nematophila]CEF28943.1 exonuclease V, alpha chain with recC and recD: 5' and 3' nuclease, ATPase, recombinase, helicase [Xenorhabdus nematophila str. Websteri]CEF33204.1 exonuclease V, alpha chain with recC and recD: 5' and 3' nuclease, ATPase, recombinase, helicase [Xenorhabdus nematophila str. Websteri]